MSECHLVLKILDNYAGSCFRLRVPAQAFEIFELEVLGDLNKSNHMNGAPTDSSTVTSVSAQKVAEMHDKQADRKKWLKVGAAAAAGGVATILTAGLAAPAIVAGAGALVGITSASAGVRSYPI